jgi:hypothetical protein
MDTTSALGNKSDSLKSAFLSHSSTDALLAGQLCARLESQGVSCWLAPRDVVPGHAYADECVRGIEQSASFVLLASASAIASVQVLSEVEQAHKRGKPLYTILIGKPKVTRELDYYISRLHWIEYGGDSVDTLAGRLAKVLSGSQAWSTVASPPSLRRTVLYRRDAFAGSAVATLLVLVVAGAGLYYWVNRRLDLDYRRLGYATVAAEPPADDPSIKVKARVWLLAEDVPFRDVRFMTLSEGRDGVADRQDHSKSFNPEQVGSQELIQFPVPAGTQRLTTCLIVPSPGLHARYRVTQLFSIGSDNSISPTAEPRATKEDGAPCGSTHLRD